jgi:alpha-galactosidase
MGIHPMGFQWHLASNQEFHTPEAILVRSSEGLGGMSRMIHRVFLDHLIPSQWSSSPPPILLNSWEAKYFDVNHDNIIEMATKAVSIGIDMIVVDDGWFGQRNSDTSSLGDWWPNGLKFPHGLKALVDEEVYVKIAEGLVFVGLVFVSMVDEEVYVKIAEGLVFVSMVE